MTEAEAITNILKDCWGEGGESTQQRRLSRAEEAGHWRARSMASVAHAGDSGELRRKRALVIPRSIVTGRTTTKLRAIQDKKRQAETAFFEYSLRKHEVMTKRAG